MSARIIDEFTDRPVSDSWKRRLRRIRDGKCISCSADAATGQRCNSCAAAVVQYNKRYKARPGKCIKCIRCGNYTGEFQLCDQCRIVKREKSQKARDSRIAAGKCVTCGANSSSYECASCTEAHRERMRQYRLRQRRPNANAQTP